MKKHLGLIAITTGLLSSQAHAHYYPENSSCRGPKKPLQFVTEVDQKLFDKKVAEFRQCLETFVARQNEAMEKHRISAENASAQWKAYVEGELGQKLQDPETEKSATSPANITEPPATTP